MLNYYLDGIAIFLNSLSPGEFVLIAFALSCAAVSIYIAVTLFIEEFRENQREKNRQWYLRQSNEYDRASQEALNIMFDSLDYSTDPKAITNNQPETLFQRLAHLRKDDEVQAAWDRFEQAKANYNPKPVLNDNAAQPRDAHGRFMKRA